MNKKLKNLPIPELMISKVPLGYQKIYFKQIIPKEIEQQLILSSDKYKKVDLQPAHTIKPISKILSK